MRKYGEFGMYEFIGALLLCLIIFIIGSLINQL